MGVLEVRGISKNFGAIQALDGVDLNLDRGEVSHLNVSRAQPMLAREEEAMMRRRPGGLRGVPQHPHGSRKCCGASV